MIIFSWQRPFPNLFGRDRWMDAFKDGVLEIRMSKTEEAKKKSILLGED